MVLGAGGIREDAEFNGANLQEQLDRTTNVAAVTVRHAVTPLTSLIFSAGRSEERFTTASTRDSTSDDYSVAVEFDPAALLKGSARVGYTAYRTDAADLEDFNGMMSAVSSVLHFPGFDAVVLQRRARHSVLVRHQSALLPADRRECVAGAADFWSRRYRRQIWWTAAGIPDADRRRSGSRGSHRSHANVRRRCRIPDGPGLEARIQYRQGTADVGPGGQSSTRCLRYGTAVTYGP